MASEFMSSYLALDFRETKITLRVFFIAWEAFLYAGLVVFKVIAFNLRNGHVAAVVYLSGSS